MDELNSDQRYVALENDPYNFVMKVFCTKWKPFLIKAINFDESTRFNRFTRQLPITEKVLTDNLRELEADGLITRTVFAEVPPRVEYSLTELGKTVCPILDTLYDWGWHEMKRRGLPVDSIGEMWHGYRERDADMMDSPYKKTKTNNEKLNEQRTTNNEQRLN